ncbi:hypothetical protein DDB_G0289233 [Dictyostelium discoideum AX4]|uniref:Vacuolar protein 14 C-terminal Fig4-binding domain-containing protein n=1 Tax=Dictyostelium discoideum TaxID=44689 RepID=Q54HT3_DICDI|nr:hypothetical protein DDB_G0289233 [Dictyostelium discoideum AX4]EAL62850.1 hypothetical protein DDB_G0289233 [Dictyostelium discoideum AX4]|eukprot:XP_636356.1 hypothetical protein DDB_G0289233 [Dictyostelium discoideum AX4]
MNNLSPIPSIVLKNLADKNTDKRKTGAQEIEQLIREHHSNDDQAVIRAIIKQISTEYTDSAQGNNKKGGLIGLASVAIGLGTDAYLYIQEIVPPVLRCFIDHDSRIRFYACESLFNIAKVTRSKILFFFNEIFDVLCKLSSDLDPQVKGGVQLFDRLLKDIVTESPTFDIDKFIPLLKERLYIINPFCRQFLVGWIIVLDSVPNIDMLIHLPKYLDGIFKMLRDQNKEIRNEADKALSEFLRELQTAENVDYGSMVKTIVPHCISSDEFTRLSALTWINEFILVGKKKLLPYCPLLLNGILSSLSHQLVNIEKMASLSNINLHKLILETNQDFPVGEFLNINTQHLISNSVQSRLASLNWILMLHSKLSSGISSYLTDLFPPLLKTLSDNSDEVVKLDLKTIAKISDNTELFDKLIQNLVILFSNDSQLLRTRGNFIIRQLCLFLNPELIFRRFSNILGNSGSGSGGNGNQDGNGENSKEINPEFASVMVQTLNLILLTSDECVEIRRNLRSLSTPESRDLFSVLYTSWAHSPASLFSLCMLCQVYEHSCALLSKFTEIEINVNFLMEMDRLVQLLESPKFMALRLQLLEPEKYPSLFKSLYGLLMILPQSSAFETLKNRLTCISSLGVLNLIPKKQNEDGNNSNNNEGLKDINFNNLLDHFKEIQVSHEKFYKDRNNQINNNNNNNNNNLDIETPFNQQRQLPYGIQSYINNKITNQQHQQQLTMSSPSSPITAPPPQVTTINSNFNNLNISSSSSSSSNNNSTGNNNNINNNNNNNNNINNNNFSSQPKDMSSSLPKYL